MAKKRAFFSFDFDFDEDQNLKHPSCPKTQTNSRLARRAVSRRCCTARSKSLTSLCRS